MNQLVSGMAKEENKTHTLNGMKIKKSSESALVDLFFAVGGSRGGNILPLFQKAVASNLDIAVRIALYARDVRGGMGERELFRQMMADLAQKDFEAAKKVVAKVPEVGRWDDLFSFVGTPVQHEAMELFAQALLNKDALALKWAPREKSSKKQWASVLRKHMGINARSYRKMLSENTVVVEQKMSANNWNDIVFEHVPSLASSRYQKAFERHSPTKYNKFIVSLENGESTINAGAVYPHDVVTAVNYGNSRVAEQQWKALPDYIGSNASFLPVVDSSGSMTTHVSTTVRAIDIASSLGLYIAQRNKSVFKDKMITFSESPAWIDVAGLDLKQSLREIHRASWQMNTNLEKVFKLILSTATKHDVPQSDMPGTVIIFSDMQFDRAVSGPNKPSKMIKTQYKDAGYDIPNIVWWNLVDYGSNTPVEFDKEGSALVSGFSPSLMKSILSADMESFTPWNIMLDAVGVERYNWM